MSPIHIDWVVVGALASVAAVLTDLYIAWILTIEYFYDKKVYEQKRRKIKRTKNKVVVSVEDGQATITEQPADVQVTIENKGDSK